MSRSIIPVQLGSIRRVCLVALLVLLVCPALVAAHPAADDPPPPPTPQDLGDAPDSTNHAGAGMTAYPGVPANFPTVYDPATGLPRGPRHANPGADSWLGASISPERDADLLPDADGVRNIVPPADDPDNDWFDDGVFPANPNDIKLPQCQQTSFNYIVTGAAVVITPTTYVNVWIDFNRDGDWADTLNCTVGGVMYSVPEWVVQDQAVAVNAGMQTTYATPLFRSFHPGGHAPAWMRITLADQLTPQSAGGLTDGRGPAGGYATGETEDYYLSPMLVPGQGIVYCNGDNG